MQTVDTEELETGEDEEIDDDDVAGKCKNIIERIKTSERTNVPTDVGSVDFTSCRIDGKNGACDRRGAAAQS